MTTNATPAADFDFETVQVANAVAEKLGTQADADTPAAKRARMEASFLHRAIMSDLLREHERAVNETK